MNILSVLWNREISTGAHSRLLHLLQGLADRGHGISLIRRSGAEYETRSVEVIEVSSRGFPSNKLDSLLSVFCGGTSERVNDCDLVLCFGIGGAVPGVYLKHHLAVPMLLGLRSYPIENIVKRGGFEESVYRFTISTYLRAILLGADRVVMQTECQREKLVRNYSVSQEKTSVIRNNIIGDLKQPKESTRAEQLLFAGTLNYRKGIDTLLRALPPLIASENIHLHVAGDGPMRNDAERFVEKNGLRECVTFHGYVDEIQVLMRRTDLVVVPSRFDSFPNVALEAMRVGTPFIASDIMDVRSAFGPATQYVPVNDPESLAEKLASLQRPDQYSELRDQCMSHRTEFDFDWVGEFESEMTKLLQSTGSEDRL